MNPQDPAPGNPQQQVIERLRTAVNVLVTVSNSPSVDQLAAAVGFTLMLNKMGKHATAVFSGDTPSTIEFLKPEATIEKNTDSLRDFIVSLDKSKADKLRYKVEDNVVKIFITPYRTSLSEKDLEFSQGDFNVDAVVALGVTEREQLDQAIIAHGRILHDATVITVSAGEKGSSLGAINWQDTTASSLCEMLVGAGELLQAGLLDNQIATAYLTGIVAQTERFRNNKTTPKLMTMSAQLMAAGANQQLIADSLDTAVVVPIQNDKAPEAVAPEAVVPADSPDGSLTIEHEDTPKTDLSTESSPSLDMPADTNEEKTEEPGTSQIAIDEHGNMSMAEAEKVNDPKMRRRLIEPLPGQSDGLRIPTNTFGGGEHPFTANMTNDGENEPSTDALTTSAAPAPEQILDHNIESPSQSEAVPRSEEPGATLPPIAMPLPTPEMPTIPEPVAPVVPQNTVATEPVAPVSTLPPLPVSSATPNPLADVALTLPPALDNDTLRDIEKTFDSTHIAQDPTSTLEEIEKVEHSPHVEQQAEVVDSARDAVASAINAAPYDPMHPQPLQALNASPLGSVEPQPAPTADPVLASLGLTDQLGAAAPVLGDPLLTASPSQSLPPLPSFSNPTVDPSGQAPPPVPPPLMPIQ